MSETKSVSSKMDSINTDAVCNISRKMNQKNQKDDTKYLGEVLFNSMKEYSNRILQYLPETNETDTYDQVLTRSIRTALKLRSKGIGRKDIISMCTYNHKNSCVPLLASFFIGAIPANFDPNLPHLDTIHLLKLLEPKIIFVSQESVPFIEKCLKEAKTKTEIVVFGESDKYEQFDEYLLPQPEEDKFKPTTVDTKETAIVMFSSGTTGLPKGICLSYRTLLENISSFNTFALKNEQNEQCISLLYTTFYWISRLAFFLDAVTNGNAMVVCSKFDPYEAWNVIEKCKVSSAFLGPHLANEFVHNRPKDADVSSLKMFFTGGSPVTATLMEDLNKALPNATVLQGYGQTETACCISTFDSTIPEEVEMQKRKPLSCGKILPRLLWKVVDPTTEEVLGPNERGELRLKNDYFMTGYYKMDSSSAFDSEGYLKTGDIVYYDEEGYLFIVDRIKEMFKYKGWHILPVLLEGVLMSHPAVKEAAVLGIPHDIDGDHPMGIVVLYDGFGHVTPKEIEEYVEQRVSDVQRLRAGVKIVDEIPRTVTGKVKRSALKKKAVGSVV